VSLFCYIYFMILGTEVISFSDNLFQVVRTFRSSESFPIDEVKEYYNCDTVLKREERLYICRKIEEAQVIEDESIQLVEEEQKESTTPEEGSITG
jgi:hypothetical protein